MKWIGWAIAGAAAVATAVYFAVGGTSGTPKDLCLKDLPDPFNKQAADVIAKGDAALIQSFATQCDAKGWHCAAKELRAEVSKIGVAAHAKMDIFEVSRTAAEPLKSQVAKVLYLFVRPKIAGSGAWDFKAVTFAKPPSSADVKMIEDLASALRSGGYSTASSQMSDAAAAASVIAKAKCPPIFERLPDAPMRRGRDPGSPPPYGVASIRTWAIESMGLPADVRDSHAGILEKEGPEWAKEGIEDAFRDAAKCLRGLIDTLGAGGGLIFPVG